MSMAAIDGELEARIRETIGANRVTLFMKGNPDFPQCGFSAQAVAALRAVGSEFGSVDILSDQELREGVKAYANWPTYPQLWVDGELVGGCDIITEMHESGELATLLESETA